MSSISPAQQIMASNVQPVDYQYRHYSVMVKDDVTPDMLTDFRLWEHVAHKLEVFDEIRVIDEAETFMARLIITFSDKKRVNVKVLDVYDLQPAGSVEDISTLFTVKQKGPLKWCLVELRDDGSEKEIIKDKIANQAAAQQEMDDYVKQLTG